MTRPTPPSDQPPPAALWTLTKSAATAGLSPKAFLAGIERKEIPLEIVRVGRRRLVRAHELCSWIWPTAPTTTTTTE